MQKLPIFVKVGGHTFSVEEKDLSTSDDLGSTDFHTGVIAIDSGLIESVKWSTLIHEGFHVMNVTMDSNEDGHRLLESLSEQMYQFNTANKLCFNPDHEHYQPGIAEQ